LPWFAVAGSGLPWFVSRLLFGIIFGAHQLHIGTGGILDVTEETSLFKALVTNGCLL